MNNLPRTEETKILATEFSDEFLKAIWQMLQTPRLTSAITHEQFLEFRSYMERRMIFSYAKYGALRDAYPHKVNAIESMWKRIDTYLRTKNTEFLIDAANFAMIEYMAPAHPSFNHQQNRIERLPIFADLDTVLDRYSQSGGSICLVTTATVMIKEFYNPSIVGAYFRSTDSNESPGRAAYDTNFDGTQKSNKELTDEEWKELHKN